MGLYTKYPMGFVCPCRSGKKHGEKNPMEKQFNEKMQKNNGRTNFANEFDSEKNNNLFLSLNN